jgi:hypothetical protein
MIIRVEIETGLNERNDLNIFFMLALQYGLANNIEYMRINQDDALGDANSLAS